MLIMIEFITGETVEHSIYGEIELYGFKSIGDAIEINELNREGETVLDVVLNVNGDAVEFLDSNGSKHQEPLSDFYEHIETNE